MSLSQASSGTAQPVTPPRLVRLRRVPPGLALSWLVIATVLAWAWAQEDGATARRSVGGAA